MNKNDERELKNMFRTFLKNLNKLLKVFTPEEINLLVNLDGDKISAKQIIRRARYLYTTIRSIRIQLEAEMEIKSRKKGKKANPQISLEELLEKI